jgi:hypothetical protein
MDAQLYIDGRGTLDDYGMRMLQVPELNPPSVNTYIVKVAGGQPIDLSEYAGDISYADRAMEFDFDVSGDAESKKTEISNWLHGRRKKFSLGWDNGYTYTGRFAISSYTDRLNGKTRIVVKVTADPYKSLGTQTYRFNGNGGVTFDMPCGRKRACPTIEVYRDAIIGKDGRTWNLRAGTYKLRDLWLSSGSSEITVDTNPEYFAYALNDYADQTIESVAAMYPRLYDAAAGDKPIVEPDTIESHVTETIQSYADTRIIELAHKPEGKDYDCYMSYDWEDL